MKKIVQKTDNDCGFACIAMLLQKYAGVRTNEAYEAAYQAITKEAERLELNRTNGPTGTRHLRPALLRHNIPVAKEMILLCGKMLDDVLRSDALLKGKLIIDGKSYTHWCVWDSANHRVLDPWRDENCVTRITSYLPVGNPD